MQATHMTDSYQIWFQNRRQSSRRKSRPLLPYEIAQYQLSRSLDHSKQSPSLASQANPGPRLEHSSSTPLGSHILQSNVEGQYEHRGALSPGHDQLYPGRQGEEARCASYEVPNAFGLSKDLAPIANRRNAQYIADMHATAGVAPSSTSAHASEPDRRQSSSIVRLSMDSEGNATVVTKDSSQPSPPRPQQLPPGLLGTAPLYVLPPLQASLHKASPSLPSAKRSSSGRSRDSRAWEFWCDKDARGELEDTAEKDASGSAEDAIGLLRSNSGRRVLGALPTKRNMLHSQHSHSSKRHKHEGPVATVSRANTSSGRLQQERQSDMSSVQHKIRQSNLPGSVRLPGNDSDKENWSPGGEDPQHPATTNALKAPQATLRASDSLSKHHDYSCKERQEPKAHVNLDDDPEVAAFMAGGRRSSSSVSGEEEMDCVQGLLSLSQGNWR